MQLMTANRRPPSDPLDPLPVGFARLAVFWLSSIEFWERYAFYNMFALLALFVAAPVGAGGMGWSGGESLRFFGVYLLSVSVAPMVGGYLSDRWLSGGLALKLGALMLLAGYGLLAGPSFIPWLVERLTRIPMTGLLRESGASIGGFSLPRGLPAELALPYLSMTGCFYGAVLLVAVGNGLFKPIITVVISRLPYESPEDRDQAFTSLFLFSNIGGLFSTLLGGWLAQTYGWGWAFGAAALGMGVARISMSVFFKAYIEPYADVRGRSDPSLTGRLGITGNEWRFAFPVSVVLGIFILLCICSYQSYGFVSLFTARLVDRTVAGVLVPTSWFTAINPITIMVMTPLLARVWRKRGMARAWSTTGKFAVSFFLIAIAFVGLVAAAAQAKASGHASPLWIIAAIALMASAELMMTPAGLSAMTRLAPPNRQNLAVGAWSAAAGVGAWLSGKVGAMAIEADTVVVLAFVGGGAFLGGMVLIALRRAFAEMTI